MFYIIILEILKIEKKCKPQNINILEIQEIY